ncbi:MAG: hypothetical protein KF901_31550 [Myxococcales bacterium]|nr:hypothetical protein [Myxococcales bacterium]
MTTTEARWAERVRDWRASGQTAEAFADGQQFEASTLTYWVSRLNRTAPTTFAGGRAAEERRDAPRDPSTAQRPAQVRGTSEIPVDRGTRSRSPGGG